MRQHFEIAFSARSSSIKFDSHSQQVPLRPDRGIMWCVSLLWRLMVKKKRQSTGKDEWLVIGPPMSWVVSSLAVKVMREPEDRNMFVGVTVHIKRSSYTVFTVTITWKILNFIDLSFLLHAISKLQNATISITEATNDNN